MAKCKLAYSPLGTLSVVLALAVAAGPVSPSHGQQDSTISEDVEPSTIEILTNDDALELLPSRPFIEDAVIPIWARALAKSLPATTAAMLELDYLHRAESPLDEITRAKLRWIAADASRCDYSRQVALADLQKAQVSADEIELLVKHQQSELDSEQHALEFAHRLTLAASTINDEQVARLIEDYGEEQLVAMVLMLAHANFQDRLIHSLGLAGNQPDVLEPVQMVRRDDQGESSYQAPRRPSIPVQSDQSLSTQDAASIPTDWANIDFDELQRQLNGQRQRASRIRIPSFEEVAAKQGIDPESRNPIRVRWTLVCLGYQPELASGWFRCMGMFHRESRQDRVFEESVFWVVTRSIDCFY